MPNKAILHRPQGVNLIRTVIKKITSLFLVILGSVAFASNSSDCNYQQLVNVTEKRYVFVADLFPSSRPEGLDSRMSEDMIRVLYPYLKDNEQVVITVHKTIKGELPATIQGEHTRHSESCGLATTSRYVVLTDKLSEPLKVSSADVIPASIEYLVPQCAKITETSDEAYECVKRYL